MLNNDIDININLINDDRKNKKQEESVETKFQNVLIRKEKSNLENKY